ncbi:MAG: protein tyrosine phosphatase family protein [Leptolyngbyaceae cyanobacterium bins.302]|nr:protein tyrosine phosphatase family protein [Leptolyngbyaceae cyanobacterium bins.302]
MENAKQVNDQITVAGQVTLDQLQQAAAAGFKSVLNLRSPNEEGFWQEEQHVAESLGLNYINMPVQVATLNEELTTKVLQQIDTLPKPALIHCAVSMRAGAMALMNVATRQGMTAQQAFELAGQIGFDCTAYPQMKEFFQHYVEQYSKVI